MFINPTVSDFKAYFFRDFPYGSTLDTVTDADIQKAIGQTTVNFNESLFSSQDNYTTSFLFLTAHYLCMDLQMSAQGILGSGTWLTTSKSVGSVAESFGIPQRILDNPELSYLSKTKYGMKYLSLILPGLAGQMFPVFGRTHA